jgi:hypothetical protein
VVRLEGSPTSALAYSNTTVVSHPISFMTPGSVSDGFWVADDVALTAGGCQGSGYEVAVYGGGGDDFDVHVELFDFWDSLFEYPGDLTCRDVLPEEIMGTGIPGTASDFYALPGSGVSYLYVPLATPLPERLWVYLSVSTNEAGWIIAAQPEIGSEAIPDCYGGNSGEFCQICFNFHGGGRGTLPGDPLAAMWTQVWCRDSAGCEDPPPTLPVDLVSYDGNGTEIDRIDHLVLRQSEADEKAPTTIIYHNDLSKPIILVDVELDASAYPGVIPFVVASDGFAMIVPSQE